MENQLHSELFDWTKELFGLKYTITIGLGEQSNWKWEIFNDQIFNDLELLIYKICPDAKLLAKSILKSNGIIEMVSYETTVSLLHLYEDLPVAVETGNVINLTQVDSNDESKNIIFLWNPKSRFFRF